MQENIESLQDEIGDLKAQLLRRDREIEVEKALEQVRIKALQMRASSQLSQTSSVLFEQLKELKINAIRSGVGIFDDENNAIELWISSETDEGKIFFAMDYVSIYIHKVFENIIRVRDKGQPFALSKLEGDELRDYYQTMSSYLRLPVSKEKTFCEYYYSFFFKEGTLNVVTKLALNDEEINIILRLTRVFGLLYTRFLDLQRAEKQAAIIEEEKVRLEHALENLKDTQAQLIQSEKMASLGELTAGIAHEIQNPLNFVNNFSEVNKELIGELREEVEKGNWQEVKRIADDIESNEEKINHHGKRADSIVKGMLQHSRSSSGVKEATDINALVSEYLRLAYHGLRAKDKGFNAVFKTDFDETIGKVNIIPQDVGRVLFNLYNNAFYSVMEKKNSNADNYEPTVTVSSSLKPPSGGRGAGVLISVKDNGNGIPQKVLDKIFQPFFTTKPAGQGTGLGLSLSYDIIKAHGGELKVETQRRRRN